IQIIKAISRSQKAIILQLKFMVGLALIICIAFSASVTSRSKAIHIIKGLVLASPFVSNVDEFNIMLFLERIVFR
uniref:hypothetical protein n=1 Tax=Staphylococcus haemolyticus TaxID=1283 RepID=UPI001C5CB71F